MRKILIVDDNENIRVLLRLTLELANAFEIHEAVDGPTAVALAATLQPDLVLLDIMMPGAFDGVETCRRIKAAALEAGLPSPKVVLVSAKPAADVQAAVAAAGADLYIIKPFGPAKLVESLNELYAPKP